MHVTDHKVDCLECHLEIQHSLDPQRIEHAAADCKSCHPNQHGEQIRMLLGEGAKSISAQHGGMAVAGIACPSCHQVKEISPTGTVLWRASTAICTQCHDEAATERLRARHEQLQGSLADIEASLVACSRSSRWGRSGRDTSGGDHPTIARSGRRLAVHPRRQQHSQHALRRFLDPRPGRQITRDLPGAEHC